MADGNLSEAFAWVKARLRRELWPREREFIETGGLAYPDDFDWDDSERPETATDENRFDARLVRWLFTEELPGVICRHEGVNLTGLWIENTLNLQAVDCGRALAADTCVFEKTPFLLDAKLSHLFLQGSKLPGLNAQRLTCAGDVFLRTGLESNGAVDLASARIGGALECYGSTFSATEGRALNCNGAVIGASVLLSDGFTAKGEVNFGGAKIAGQLACVGGNFSAPRSSALNCNASVIGADVLLTNGFTATGEVDFTRAEVAGNLLCRSARIEGIFATEVAKIRGGFFWEKVSGKIEFVRLTEAFVGLLSDDNASWACVETAKLSGFCFDSIQSDMTVQHRLSLLARKGERRLPPSPSGYISSRRDFDPQPYSQLAKVYDSMGHRADANKVRLARDWRLMLARLNRAVFAPRPDGLHAAMGFLSLFWSAVYWLTFGFGYAPFRALLTAGVIWGGTFFIADQTYQRGEFAPASPVVLASPEWLIASAFGCPGAQEPGCTMPLRRWEQSVSYRDYETFSPALYALDLFLPLDTLAQEESWAPSKDRGPWGWTLYWGRWLIQLSGWLLLTTAAAVFSGVLGKKD